MSRFRLHLRGASQFSPITYDTRWGTSTDANGWITQNLPGGGTITYLDTVNGADANNGSTAALAKKTYNAAWTQFRNFGAAKPGDKLLIAEGSVCTDTTSDSLTAIVLAANTPTPGPSNLTCIQSYDPADPTNQAKWGRAVGSAMPVIIINSSTGTSLNVVNLEGAGYVLYQGLEIKSTSNTNAYTSAAVSWQQGNHPGMVFQNCRFNGTGIGNNPATGTNTAATNTQNGGLMSKCSMWNSQGIFVECVDNFWIQDLVIAHCGWDIYATRDDTVFNGAPQVFTHNFYLHASNTNMHLNRIVSIDAPDGLGTRCGAVSANQLVSIDSPVGMTAGGRTTDIVAEAPNGVSWQLNDAVIMGSDKQIAQSFPGGWGLEWTNTVNGSYSRNVALFDFDAYSVDPTNNRYVATDRLSSGQIPQYMLCDKWSGYNFAITGESDVGTDMANSHLSFSNSVLDVLPTGAGGSVTNVTTRSVAPAGYKTRTQTWVALGYATKAAAVNAMLYRPDIQWAPVFCGISLPAMGLTPLYATLSPPSVVSSPPTVYPTALADLTISTISFARGTASIAILSGIAAGSSVASSDLPSGFSMSAFSMINLTGNTTSGSNQLTSVSNVTGVTPGLYVTGPSGGSIPDGTYVRSVSGSTITMSANASASSTGGQVNFYGGGRALRYDGTGSGAATPTIHVVETAKDTAMGTHTTAFTLAIS